MEQKKPTLLLLQLLVKRELVTISGDSFKKGEIFKPLCPVCKEELEVLFECECGAPMYLIYLDNNKNKHYGVSFCSKVGCVYSSRMIFSKEAILEFLKDHIM